MSSAHPWNKVPLKYVSTLNPTVQFDKLQKSDEVTFLPMDRVKNGYFIPNTGKLSEISSSHSVFSEGDLLIAKVTPCFENGNIAIAEGLVNTHGFGSSELFVLRPTKIETRFLFWHMQSLDFKQKAEASMTGAGGLKRVSSELMRQHCIDLPSHEIQFSISRFIDLKTARIDTLIAKKTRFIELLKEKRQAVITKAVTKGLDDSVEMRDSGEEWIGEIPRHWSSVKFSFVARVTEGLVDPRDPPYRDMVLVAPNHIESGTGKLLAQETAAEQGAESGKYTCKQGAVIYSKIRPALAKVVIAPCDCLCSADMYPMNCSEKTRPEWLFYLMLSTPFTAWAVLESDRVAMPKINRESLSGLRVFVPPLEEQTAIVTYISAQLVRIDSLILKTERSIELLKEHRAALITAAVTGKIDVREAA